MIITMIVMALSSDGLRGMVPSRYHHHSYHHHHHHHSISSSSK